MDKWMDHERGSGRASIQGRMERVWERKRETGKRKNNGESDLQTRMIKWKDGNTWWREEESGVSPFTLSVLLMSLCLLHTNTISSWCDVLSSLVRLKLSPAVSLIMNRTHVKTHTHTATGLCQVTKLYMYSNHQLVFCFLYTKFSACRKIFLVVIRNASIWK